MLNQYNQVKLICGISIIKSQVNTCTNGFLAAWEVNKRVSYIENHWPYFIGFGFPMALLASLPSSIIYTYVVDGNLMRFSFVLMYHRSRSYFRCPNL